MQRYIKRAVAENLKEISDLLSDDDCEITAEDILKAMTTRTINEHEADEIRVYLNT